MGLLDGLRAVLGVKAERDASRDADPEDLFGMSTAYITMAAELGYEYDDEAALCFSDADTRTFAEAIDEVVSLLEVDAAESDTDFDVLADDHGYRWVVLRESDPEDAVANLHFAADTFIERGYGSRLLAGVFAFRDERRGKPVYWIYSFRRGAFYPFAPRRGRERDSDVEFKLETHLDGELDVERQKEYWYPLWPSRAGRHPWE